MKLLNELLMKIDLNEQEVNKTKINDLTNKALDSFWKVITDQYPTLKPDLLPKDSLIKFENFDREALKIVQLLVSSSL